MHWKIQRDPYLSALHQLQGEAAVWAAGFFFDEDPEDAPLDDVDWLCTPRPKLAGRGERPVVLLATGAFCPVHPGHLAIMESARHAATRAGFEVVGGYLSPGHDAYIQLKCGATAIPAQQRLLQCARAVADSDWLSVDPWESMHRRVSVNYTDVCARLRAYLRARVDPRIEVLFVCGADNARFASAFVARSGCVVVGRPAAEAEFNQWQTRLAGLPRILWAPGDHPAASRQLRTGQTPAEQQRRLVVRLEDARAVRTLGQLDFSMFQREFVALLRRYATVRCVALDALAAAPADVISLDAMLPAAHNLALSRLFAVGGYEALGHVARPGAAALETQVAALPAGRYILQDDDQMTGNTLAAVKALLPPNVSLSATRLALEHAPDEDVLDSRDFLLGADHGGLVLALPCGGVGRAPYLLPYVDPAARASIQGSHAFSIEVWELNARVFAAADLRLRDLPPATRSVFAGDPERPLADVCAWHAARLQRLQGLTQRAGFNAKAQSR